MYGDGTRVKRNVPNVGTTYYIGNCYKVWVPNSGTTTFNKFYYFGAQRVAAKIAGTLFYPSFPQDMLSRRPSFDCAQDRFSVRRLS